MKKVFPLAALFLVLSVPNVFADEIFISKKLRWNDPVLVQIDESGVYQLSFNDAYYSYNPFLPAFQKSVFFPSNETEFSSLELKNLVFDSTDQQAFVRIEDLLLIDNELVVEAHPIMARHKKGVNVSFIPLVRNPETGKILRLIAFDIHIQYETVAVQTEMLKSIFVEESMLASGNWYKFAVSETGVHRITYNDLVGAGLNPAGINPQHVRLFGNGGGMLPEPNNSFRHDDLIENAIIVVGEEDGVFNQGDYILFFGQSPHQWKYSPASPAFEHLHNIYDDHNYYFLTADKGMGKRIGTQPIASLPATDIITTFNDYQVYENNTSNLIKSGRQWYGEVFDAILTRNFSFSFPNRVLDSVVNIQAHVAARSLQSSSFTFNINGTNVQTSVAPVSDGPYAAHARDASMTRNLAINQEIIDIKLTYNKSPMPSTGWLNYIRVHAVRRLSMSGDQMLFRNRYSVGTNRVSEFRIANTSNALRVWNVTDAGNVSEQQTNQSGNEMVFTLTTDMLREFIVFDPSKNLSVEFVEIVPNQNLHSAPVPDMLIVTHPIFLDQANRLAEFHTSFSGLSVLVATTPQIYNEFSSGKQDVGAIRDFARMFYERSGTGSDFRYLLLFGDASYDYKDRIANNTNMVPVWVSEQSLDPINSYVTDDFFGFLDPHEGADGIDILDIGIGRLPVSTNDEAIAMVDKIIQYASNSHVTMADWRNNICFVADDEDNNLHIAQAETMASTIDTSFAFFNLSKIYLDAYQQVSVPGGERFPEANQDINKSVQQGALIVNYTGHGGILGWAKERVLELSDIKGWTNYDKLAVFITATCEFAYFDDPAITSAGEMVLLNTKGGGVALFTTSRPTYASPNFTINKRLFEFAFLREDNEYLRFGDIIRLAKQDIINKPAAINAKKFLLLGDPALKLAIPEYNVLTTHVNEYDINTVTDTLKALSMTTIKGIVTDYSGNVMESFNGVLTPTVFDKVQKINTLANDGGSTYAFTTQQNIIYKGNASVTNGHFSFSFIVPKDIAYAYDTGKISYYATDGVIDANGFDKRIIIGGFNVTALDDLYGPEIELYINDEKFESGGITDQNPVLLAFVRDEKGINTTGSGIGHDITAVLNHETDKAYVLNDFYTASLDTYQEGTIRYPFFNLPNGKHHLKLKVWDIYNNPAEKEIEFIVASNGTIALEEILTYPNPFRDYTHFRIEHNQAGADLELEIQIYSLDGRLRKVISENIRPGGYRSDPVTWNGRGDDGQLLESGTYIYKVILRSPESGIAQKGNKLVIIRHLEK
ncbi:MAG: type IX secretion system sortase PorU [Bacteroidales bacterium]|nr:type IX secretion system sortase PorU [Bacteroidales bacterium]